MKLILSMLAMVTIVLLGQGCTKDSVQRTIYGALNKIQEQRCREDPSLDCSKAESYDAYQRRRKEAVEP